MMQMTSFKVLRWYLLLAAAGIVAGLALISIPTINAERADAIDWILPDVDDKPLDAGVTTELANMQWWGDREDAKPGQDSSNASATSSTRKVDWFFRGVVDVSGKRFALIAKDAASPVERFAKGDALPGGEVLESIESQSIRFSLQQETADGGQERKLYAPAE